MTAHRSLVLSLLVVACAGPVPRARLPLPPSESASVAAAALDPRARLEPETPTPAPTLPTEWPEPRAAVPGVFVRVEPATFRMGLSEGESCGPASNAPPHLVTLTHPFELMDAEVTQAEYLEVAGESPSGSSPGCAECPVDSIDWHRAVRYANALSDTAGLPLCYECAGERCAESLAPYACAGYRLPTEAELEHAYRAGTTTTIYTGDIEICGHRDPALAEISWFLYSSDGHTHPVRSLRPNAFGFFDLSGNVWEWATDGYRELGADEIDPVGGPHPDDLRVLRGGSYNCLPHEVRAAHRSALPSTIGGLNMGFRVARTLARGGR